MKWNEMFIKQLERIGEEVVTAYFKLMLKHSPEIKRKPEKPVRMVINVSNV
jgi:hypothetical protein